MLETSTHPHSQQYQSKLYARTRSLALRSLVFCNSAWSLRTDAGACVRACVDMFMCGPCKHLSSCRCRRRRRLPLTQSLCYCQPASPLSYALQFSFIPLGDGGAGSLAHLRALTRKRARTCVCVCQSSRIHLRHISAFKSASNHSATQATGQPVRPLRHHLQPPTSGPATRSPFASDVHAETRVRTLARHAYIIYIRGSWQPPNRRTTAPASRTHYSRARGREHARTHASPCVYIQSSIVCVCVCARNEKR